MAERQTADRDGDRHPALERGLEGIEALQQRWEQAAREVEAALAQR